MAFYPTLVPVSGSLHSAYRAKHGAQFVHRGIHDLKEGYKLFAAIEQKTWRSCDPRFSDRKEIKSTYCTSACDECPYFYWRASPRLLGH